MHLVLRVRQSGLRHYKTLAVVDREFERVAKKYGVRVYRYANVGNHIHAVIKLTKRHLWAAFIREVTSKIAAIARLVFKELCHGSFWLGRPFTRIVSGWKRAFQMVCEYVELNQLEAAGLVDRSLFKTTREWRDRKNGCYELDELKVPQVVGGIDESTVNSGCRLT